MDQDWQALRTDKKFLALEFDGEKWSFLFGRAAIQAC